MKQLATADADAFYAETYDTIVSDWPGEIDFYRALAAEARSRGQAVLDVACGTGRISLRLAQDGADVVGLDLSPSMLAVARRKSRGMNGVRWVQGDMRSFELGESVGLAIIAGHSFQNITAASDQVATFDSIGRHLVPGGLLVVHLDQPEIDWLGKLTRDQAGVFETSEPFVHPKTGYPVRTLQAWSYHPATQTAVSHKIWEVLGPDDQVLERIEREPIQLHVVFCFEMEHLLARAGFRVQAVYGDFHRGELRDDSSDMIWLARNPET